MEVEPSRSTDPENGVNRRPNFFLDEQDKKDINRNYSSASTTFYNPELIDRPWFEDKVACDYFYSILTSLYALVAVVFAIVVELSQKFTPQEWFAETLFYMYMYGAGIIFFLYCYLFMIHPGWCNYLLRLAEKYNYLPSCKNLNIPKTHHTGEGAGSLYLRLGTLFFGSIGIVLYGLEIFMCISNSQCFNYQLVNLAFACAFTFIQMHFVFCNSKIAFVGSKNLAKLGTMHLLSVNVWTWLRFVLAKHAAKSMSYDQNSEQDFSFTMDIPIIEKSVHSSGNFNVTVAKNKVSSFYYFGDLATFLTTCIIEYSVIGAAIMFVLWRSIDHQTHKPLGPTKRKSKVRIDCSSSSGGLFTGVLFLIGSFVSIGMYSKFLHDSNSKASVLVFRLSDMGLFCFTLLGCILGLYRMRKLQYARLLSSNAEFLDEILLGIGVLGELTHCSTGIVCWIAMVSDKENKLETYMLFVFMTRMVQVIIQTIFILLAARLRALSEKAMAEKPGKQFVTFLLLANVSLFVFHTLEGMKTVFGEAAYGKSARPYTFLITAVSPLIVFFRFHSSVCLAEIWKNCYNVKFLQARTPQTANSQITEVLSSSFMTSSMQSLPAENRRVSVVSID